LHGAKKVAVVGGEDEVAVGWERKEEKSKIK
jgi:hypothetical protein